MIPQIITKNFASKASRDAATKKIVKEKAVKKPPFFGVKIISQKTGVFCEAIGIKIRSSDVMSNSLKVVGIISDKAMPWEVHYCKIEKVQKTWGAHAYAKMQSKKRVYTDQLGSINRDGQVSDNPYYGAGKSATDMIAQAIRETPSIKRGAVPKMRASRRVSGVAQIQENSRKKNLKKQSGIKVDMSYNIHHQEVDTSNDNNAVGIIIPQTLQHPDANVIVYGQADDRIEEVCEKNESKSNEKVSLSIDGLLFEDGKNNVNKNQQDQSKGQKRVWVRDVLSRAVGAPGVALLLLLTVILSVDMMIPFLYAEVRVGNYTQEKTHVTEGLTLLMYEDHTQEAVTTISEFNSGEYTEDQFIPGQSDITAPATDGITLSHYGDTPPDLSTIDWWDDDSDTATKYNWRYRRCFEIDNAGSGDDLNQYQVYLDIDTQTVIGDTKMLANGADIRFTNEDGDVLPHFIADDINTTSTKIWVQVDDIIAGDTESLCMYYGNPSATDSASREAVFTYDNAREIYHVVADTASGSTTDFASYSGNNEITVAAYSDTLDATDYVTYPTGASGLLTEASSIATTHPVNVSYRDNGTDNVVPVAAANTQFVYATERYTNDFSIISPWCSASLTFENGLGNNILDTTSNTISPFSIPAGGSRTITTNDTTTNGIVSMVIIEEAGDDCPVLITHHGSTGGDSMTLFGADTQWYGVGSGSMHVGILEDTTSVTVYKSNGTTVGPTIYNRGDDFTINDTGSQGSEVSHRIVADKPIGAHARGDGDGGESATFLPVSELGYRYYIADTSQYIAIATSAGVTTTVDLYHDGTSCGVGTPDDTQTVAATGNAPGKAYFGLTTNGNHIPAGACVIADQPIFAYNEYNGSSDEHNIWNEKQNRQFVSPEPVYAFGTEEIGGWSIDGTNTWTRRMPITIDNTSGVAIDEYQVFIDLAGQTALYAGAQSDAGDVRVAGALGDGTDSLDYVIDNYDDTAQEGALWIKTDSITATTTKTYYLYYNIGIGYDINSLSPLLWLDANDTATITQTGGAVSQWDDKSGNANNVVQSTIGSQPSLTMDAGNQVISFDDQWMQDVDGLWGATAHDDTHVFAVYKNLILPDTGALFFETVVGGRYGAWSPWNTTLYYQPGTASYLTATYAGDTTDYHVVSYESHAGGARVLRRDGTTLATDTNGATFTGDNQPFIVAAYPGGANAQNVNIAEMIIFDKALTATEITDVETYLDQKWITGGASTALTTTGNYESLWQTTSPKENYYVVDSRSAAVGSMFVISAADGNDLVVGGTSETVDEGQITSMPKGIGIDQSDVYSVTGPLSIGYEADTTDAALPISYAGTEFLMRVGRNADIFSFHAPFAAATIEIQESSAAGFTTLQTISLASGATVTVPQDITNNRVFKIISDEPILTFHRNDTNDSKILYPAKEAFVESSGQYELYGIGSGSIQLAAGTDTTATIYRSNGTNTTVTLDTGSNFGYTESGVGAQGTAYGYRIVSDDPIAASSYADGDGGETVAFVGHKEFSREYIVPNPAQYMSIVTRDADTECRVYDEAGVAVTSGPAEMDNVPPQTAGTQTLPYPNRIHIGGDDTGDGAFFEAGYRLECDDPVYAYYEHHLSAAVTDETSWLTWPQVRSRNHVEPVIGDVNTAVEEGLYFESGFDGSEPEATATYIFDTSSETYGEHTYWQDITWDERITDRGALGSVQQVKIETAYADGPNCTSATYSSYTQATGTQTLATSNDTSPLHYDIISNKKKASISEDASDHDCLAVRITLATGDPALTPMLEAFTVGYYVPDTLADQLSAPNISVSGTVGSVDVRQRILKALTSDPDLSGSEANLTFTSVSDGSPFTTADLELYEIATSTSNPQFTFPVFPAGELNAATSSVLDASNDLAVYYVGQRSAGSDEQIGLRFNLDIIGAGGPTITRDFTIDIEG